MQKTWIILIAAAALITAFAGCGKNKHDDNPSSKTYTVTFNSNEGSAVAAQPVVEGGKATEPAVPTKAGRIFVGWYKDNTTFTDKWDFATRTVTAATTLYAQWAVAIDGVGWAERNVAAFGTFVAKPEDVGMYYQWNRAKAWPASGPSTGWDETPATGTVWAAANDPCPAGWQVPTWEQVQSLYTQAKMIGTSNGVDGAYFGTAPDRIFLPATGYLWVAELQNTNSGYYYSSDSANADLAYGFEFNTSSGNILHGNGYTKTGAQPIRCVKK